MQRGGRPYSAGMNRMQDPRRRAGLGAKLALGCGAALIVTLAAQGVASWFGRDLRRGFRPDPVRAIEATLRAGIEGRGAANEGSYQRHPDPFVRYTARAGATIEMLGVPAGTDALGMRKRNGDAPGADALRIAIVGDSIAFGYGLRDEETLAARFEHHLNVARRDGARPVACFTVAAPGWNHRQSASFLLDHFDAIAPDHVLVLPISNDLYDAEAVDLGGSRVADGDPAAFDPLLVVSANGPSLLRLGLDALRRRAGFSPADPRLAGPEAVTSGLGPESQRRYADAARSLVAIERATAQHGGSTFAIEYLRGEFTTLLRATAERAGFRGTWIPLLARIGPQLTLKSDPHPSASTIDGLARILVARLGDLLLNGACDEAAIPQPAELSPWLAPPDPHPTAAIDGAAARVRRDLAARLRDRYDADSLEGVRQVLGGIHPDSSLARRAALLLARRGDRVTVELQRIAARPDLYPLEVEVTADGNRLGVVTLAADGPLSATATFELPPSRDDGSVEITLAPSRAAIVAPLGFGQVSAARLVRVAVE
jgi:hypothetical protein